MVYAGKVLYKYKGTMSENATITINQGTPSITGNAFYDCKTLTSVTIPSSVTEIGDKAFYNCSLLANIYAENVTPSICQDNTFMGDGLEEIDIKTCILHIPMDSKGLYQTAVGWRDFVNIAEDIKIPNFTISVIVSPSNWGTVDGGGSYNQGTTVSLQATPNQGYIFHCWKENGDSINNQTTYSFVATQNRTLTAVFVLIDVVITPEPISANIAWNTIENAQGYILIIYTDASKTQEYARFEFNSKGNLLTKSGFSHTITGLTPETHYYYTLTAYDENKQEIKTIESDFTTLKTTGIEEAETEEAKFVVYPNPLFNGKLTIETSPQTPKGGFKDGIQLYDLVSKLVGTFAITGEKTEINIGHLPSGTYFVKVGTQTAKIIKR